MGLRGLDVPVTIVGSKTEGKNCGMDVQEKNINSATYSYAPITFLNLNAKGFSDYADGIEADIDITTYGSKTDNENVQYFSRVFPMPFCDWGATNRDLALHETVLQICGMSVLDGKGSSESAAMKPAKLEMAGSMTRAGEPLKLEHKRKVFGATLREEERVRMSLEE